MLSQTSLTAILLALSPALTSAWIVKSWDSRAITGPTYQCAGRINRAWEGNTDSGCIAAPRTNCWQVLSGPNDQVTNGAASCLFRAWYDEAGTCSGNVENFRLDVSTCAFGGDRNYTSFAMDC